MFSMKPSRQRHSLFIYSGIAVSVFASPLAASGEVPKTAAPANQVAASTVGITGKISPCLETVPVLPSPWIAIKNTCNGPVSAQFRFGGNVVRTFAFPVGQTREGSFSRSPFTLIKEVPYEAPTSKRDSVYIEFDYPVRDGGGWGVDVVNRSGQYIDLKFRIHNSMGGGTTHIIAKPGLTSRVSYTTKKPPIIEYAETEPVENNVDFSGD